MFFFLSKRELESLTRVRYEEQINQNITMAWDVWNMCVFGVMLAILVCNGPSPYHLCSFDLILKLPLPRKHRLCKRKTHFSYFSF